jgi:EAL domain-containing protein (putative c-di-GMP-specific phosphodiesterase class I)
VLNTALRKQKELSENYLDIPVSVNFSPFVIQQTNIDEVINKAMGIWGNNPSNLVVEITETAIMDNGKETIRILSKIKDIGVAISIDDFGTGYSSLAYFKNIPADEIKIDKSFVKNLLNDKADYNVVRTIINLAHDFGHTVVAEGVEDEETWRALKILGCDVIQGYLVSKPLIYDDLIKWLEDYKNYAIAIGSE